MKVTAEVRKKDKEIQITVAERDVHCVLCGSYFGLSGHHLIHRYYKLGRHDIKNVYLLCFDCHQGIDIDRETKEMRIIFYAIFDLHYWIDMEEYYEYARNIKAGGTFLL